MSGCRLTDEKWSGSGFSLTGFVGLKPDLRVDYTVQPAALRSRYPAPGISQEA
jgi:hypothetical protein